ncbi:MAG: DUF1553 domain-containing protein [Bacteroidota bacterium]
MRVRLRSLLLLVSLMTGVAGGVSSSALSPPPLVPFETADWSTPANNIDALVEAELAKEGLKLGNPSSDQVFIRRIYLDMLGTLPQPEEAEEFFKDRRPEKRRILIDSLFDRAEYADYWSLKWCDLLRVKSEFPINLWPNAVQAYHRWIRDSLRDNMPYDDFARTLLTSSGSNFRVPQVNFYRATSDRTPLGIAKAVTLTFMGARMEKWPEERKAGMAAFFSGIAFKKSLEWKEEIVLPDPALSKPIKATFPDGATTVISADTDPRRVFADWLITPKNPWFARNITNRIWAWTMGHGIIHEPDDIRVDNPPACPELLSYLEGELVRSGYDLRHVYRLIFNSRTYQQSSIIPQAASEPQTARFARYTVRRLDAEVLIDAFCRLGGDGESYSSPVPEPFTYIPNENRTIALADGSITSPFLATFGRPARDTGLVSERNNEPSDTQRLYLLNSEQVQSRIEKSPYLKALIASAKGNRAKLINGTYLFLLSRYPTEDEMRVADRYMVKSGLTIQQAVADLAWALINGKEFLFRH